MKQANRFNSISPGWNAVITVFLAIIAVVCLAPLILLIVISFTSADSIAYNGYAFWPSEWSTVAYSQLMKTGTQIVNGYKVTIAYTIVNTILSLLVMSMYAYVMAQKQFRGRTFITFFAFFTMLFGGGLVPSYIINVKYLGLYDTFWIFVLPGLMSAYNCIILRTFVQTTIPESLFEAAKIDGAGHFRIYAQIVMPLFKAGLATIGLFKVVGNWNDWFTGMLYIENPKLTPLNTMLTRIMDNINFIKANADKLSDDQVAAILNDMPTESCRMAITVITVAPILFAYPFFQRYFVQGLTIGSVKG
ncbi:MAG: carbohydrate ABC transporter permease [Ruminococcaceae bacterium]|nr:carbohydrate ABC transporter permease [Oscillospiraceae bacterium]